ncbi:MAG: 50S ribosomal protein L6 [Candidatus Aenigmarchaeota archaeon]|nr:50S ribosomal protein L6 [Candidatus Aenigmarchaeota archaeon]
MMKKISIPEGVEVDIQGKVVTIKGPKGELSRDFGNVFTQNIDIRKENNDVTVESKRERRKDRALVGTIIAHIRNMFTGVTQGYSYTLKVHYVHFPINVEAKKNGDEIEIIVKNFLGEKVPRTTKVKGVNVEVKKDEIIIKGINKELVGQAAARIEQICKVRRRDRRVFHDGIYLIRKEVGM